MNRLAFQRHGERGDSPGDLIATWAKERRYQLAERAPVDA
jgi:hypothetical protein